MTGTASTELAIVGGDADENMNIVRTEAEAWRLIHSRYAQTEYNRNDQWVTLTRPR